MSPCSSSILIFVCFLSQNWYHPNGYDLRIGVLLPFEDPYLKPLVGYETSAGAVTVALDRIKEERLLPGANIRYDLVYF